MKKKIIKVMLMIVAVIVMMVGIGYGSLVLLINEDDFVGTWRREVMYLEKYGCDVELLLLLEENGKYESILCEDGNEYNILNTTIGTWEVKGINVVCYPEDTPGGHMKYEYNPISKTLKNNKIFEKIE